MYLKDFHAVSKNIFQTQTNIQQLYKRVLSKRFSKPGLWQRRRTFCCLFYKIVEQEQGAIRNATLAAVEQLQKGIHCYICSCERSDGNHRLNSDVCAA
jgi:hypothetical protein